MEQEVEKGQKFKCAVCGGDWSSKVKRSGPRLCKVCVELRRAVNGFLNGSGDRKPLEVGELKERIEKILEG